ncbi:metallophosphoesterase family protein [Paenibacillus flagellatus]|uniref:metallophosphoesterase family protein n=1 Tax=Paenibacillus flagellatus TaxID=2211139 RepID=UPI00319E9680
MRWLAGVAAAAGAAWLGLWKWENRQGGRVAQDAGIALHPPTDVSANDGALLSFFILSDLHVNAGFRTPGDRLRKALADIETFGSKAEAIVVTGDATESATEKDYAELRSILDDFKRLPPIYANMGNHEYYSIWINENGGWSKETAPNGKSDAMSREAFLSFFGLKKPYHDVWLKGHHIVLLSQETYVQEKPEVSEGAWYSDEQMDWFRRAMAEPAGGKPVFVMIHQPLPPAGRDGGAHQLIRAIEFRDILKPYPNVFVFWGHNHLAFDSGTHYVRETFHGFNNSSVGKARSRQPQSSAPQAANADIAQGLFVEVYADKVRVRGREFADRTWVAGADWTIPLEAGNGE